ncbi:MAG: hypothetical protein IOC64_11815 [Methylobacterium sp.]|nr:hypothetical protein [Methylobacterium sp.]MCA3607715.1 hypothetical protein [Methylobacterium sp.]MCA3609111.1 hypothetical protein [Methylobacterium sp.]MCA3618802.1 hypothetical protein [Methylobacterium sp.]MCA3621040.1 hypothetical protein [Methylobacterium sp.]
MKFAVSAQIVEQIYEAAFVPEMWPSVLDSISKTVSGAGAMLFTTDLHNVSRWTASPAVHEVMIDWIAEGWQTRTKRTHKMVGLRHSGFITVNRPRFAGGRLG